MNPFELRPHLRDCVEAVLSKFSEYRRLLAVVPTAGGKTVIFSTLAQCMQPVRTLIPAHREEIFTPATTKQLSTPQQLGVDPDLVRNKGHASALLDTLFSRRSHGPATAKQVAWLRRTNHPHPQGVSFAHARRWLSDRFNRRAA